MTRAVRVSVLLGLVASCYEPRRCDLQADLSCAGEPGTDAFDFWPFVVETFPPENAKGVPLGITPTVKFTEPVFGVSPASITLAPATAVAVMYDASTRTASVDPEALLAPSTQYVITLSTDIIDATGNALYGKKTWTFKTQYDNTAPSVTMVSPVSGATDVATDVVLVAEFSEQVSHVTNATFVLADGSGSVSATVGFVSETATKLTPSQRLAPHTLYTATLAASITDLIGNPLADAPVTWSFTTGADTTAQ